MAKESTGNSSSNSRLVCPIKKDFLPATALGSASDMKLFLSYFLFVFLLFVVFCKDSFISLSAGSSRYLCLEFLVFGFSGAVACLAASDLVRFEEIPLSSNTVQVVDELLPGRPKWLRAAWKNGGTQWILFIPCF